MQTAAVSKKSQKLPLMLGLVSIAFLFLLGGPGSFLIPSSAATSQYHNVQIFLQTQGSEGNLYTLIAYESNGTLISSSQSQYPAFSLELPTGTYLFAASVVNKSSTYYWWYSTSEYGYTLQQISSDTVLNLQTSYLSSIPNSSISVQAKFVNGSVMQGASVYASVIGLWYWSPIYSGGGIDMWNQTGSNGVATLRVPDLPLEVTAWNWVRVDLPTSQTTVQKNVGGEMINVTVYWEPMYVGLSGSTVIIPPQNSAVITLHAEQEPNYWMYSPGVMYATNTVAGGYQAGVTNGQTFASMGSAPTAVPSQVSSAQQQFAPGGPTQYTGAPQYLPPTQIPAVIPANSSNSMNDEVLVAAVVIAVVLAGGSFLAMFLRRGKKEP
jgi:hypothetical protein